MSDQNTSRVLLICYYFPPLGGAGVGRPLSLYRYLPDHGILCDVLTVKQVTYRQYEPALLEGVDTSRIYRSGSLDPQRLLYLAGVRKVKAATIRKGKPISDRFFPDPKIGWVRPAVNLGRVLTANRRYDCLISTSPPISSHLVARKLAREFNIPWLADFRDFWTLYKAEEWFSDPRKVNRAKALLGDITGEATAVTVVNPAIAEYLKAGEVIYNSYDDRRAALWKPPDNRESFKIGVLGTIDKLRPIEPLFRLMAYLREHRPDSLARLKVVQVGSIYDDDFDALLDTYQLRERVECHGLRDREETIRLLSQTSMLYIGLCPEHGRGVVPARLFDLLASGRPLLAAATADSEVARLIRETGSGICFDETGLIAAAECVAGKMDGFLGGDDVIRSDRQTVARFSSRTMTQRFAETIRRITSAAASS